MRISFGRSQRVGSVGSKIFMTLFGLAFGSIGLFIAVMAVKGGLRDRATLSWETATCVIESAVVDDKGDGYSLKVQYRYEYGGREYTSSNYKRDKAYNFDEVAKRGVLLEQFKQGKSVPCYVNADNPAEAVLYRKSSLAAILLPPLFCSIFVLIGYGMVVVTWLPKRGGMAPVSKSSSSSGGKKSIIGVTAFCSVFILIGLIVPYFTFVKPLQRQNAAKRWTPLDAVVTKSKVRSHSSDDGTTYSVYVAYKYKFKDRDLEGDRYEFTGMSSSGYDSKKRIVAQFPPGKSFKLYVDPENPVESVINRDVGGALYFGLIPLVFAVFGTVFLTFFLKSKSGGRSRYASRRRAGRRSSGRHDRLSPEPMFKSATSNVGRIVGMAIFALIWNGIVSVFVVLIVQGWMAGDKPIGLTLFISIFVAAGIGIVMGLVYQIMRAFNPSVELQSSASVLTPGQSLEIPFRVVGKLEKLQKLTFSLTAMEEVRYRRGTDTVTDRHEVFKELLFEESSAMMMSQGVVNLTIPYGAMHSFDSSDNKFMWWLKVHGEIRRWPDLSETYTLSVVAAEAYS